eukprot:TRINITY_DN16682_c0_g1_i1.p1 TRINITY_DN16682_c0_g1~~TRINITY_DN16682_c0_g1_i1.p1  ORF type:complete len:700 (-),score=155.59 TRINITY_DN16682_c0_g1_i1:193-2292(-)
MSAETWSVKQVKEWATSNGFDDLANIFEKQEVDGSCLLDMDFKDDDIMKDFGLTYGKASKLTKAIAALKPGQPPTTTMLPPVGTTVPPSATVQSSPQPVKQTIAATPAQPVTNPLDISKLRAVPIVKPIEQSSGIGSMIPAALSSYIGVTKQSNNKPESNVQIDENALDEIIKTMLKEGQDGDIEVAIVSVMGKFRGGKSFLLNLLVYYFDWLEKNQNRLVYDPRQRDTSFKYQNVHDNAPTSWLPEWLPPKIGTPFKVDALSDTQTCTKGLWILNRPFFLRKKDSNKKIALLLLDSQGADDGVLDEAQSRAILGITTVFSSTVIYNVKMPLDTKHVKDLSDLANILQVAIGDIQADADNNSQLSEEQRSFGRLCFLLRDARFRDGDTFQGCVDRLKSETANKLDPEKCHINKERVEQLHNSFQKPRGGPFGLPHPGDEADFMRSSTTDDMTLVNDTFKKLLDDFLWQNFEATSPEPVKRILTEKPLTATSFIDYLERIKEAFATCMVSGGDPEIVLMYREEQAEDAFTKMVDELSPETQSVFPKDELLGIKDEAMSKFARNLSNGLTAEAQERWVKRFDEFMDGYIAKKENIFLARQTHGDKALGCIVLSAVLMSVTGTWGLVCTNWIITACTAGVVTIGAFIRHAHDNHKGPCEAPPSFVKTSFFRIFEIFGSAKKFFMRGASMFGMASMAAKAKAA